jgi:superfamily II DNA/RNA helicase
MTVYIAPNKPVCNEFMIFAYNNNFAYAVGTEDFFDWNQLKDVMENGGILICTPPIFLKILLFPSIRIIDDIGSIIFDEMPNLMKNHLEMPIIILIAKGLDCQKFMLSATFSNETMEMMKKILGATILEPEESIRPVDIVSLHYDQNNKKVEAMNTTDLYSETSWQWKLNLV